MHKMREHHLEQSRVTALFANHSLSFILAKGATLEELSDRLADLGQRQSAKPLAITVKFDVSSRKIGFEPISASGLPAAMLKPPRQP